MARFRQLDALRGLAAVAVMLHHFVSARVDSSTELPPLSKAFWITYRSLHILLLGQESVVLFFVLSGFVLAIAIPKRVPLRYGHYVLHRICRIYLPYLAALILSVWACAHFHGQLIPWTPLTASTWEHAPKLHQIAQQVFFLGTYDQVFNAAFWSLVYEMRISLFVPVLVLAMRRMAPHFALAVGAILSIVDSILQPWVREHLARPAVDAALTLHYALFFCFGIFIALHPTLIDRMIRSLSAGMRYLVLLMAIVLACYGWAAFQSRTARILNLDWMISLGAGTIICFALYDAKVASFLVYPPFLWLGRISYSLYLLHLTVFFSLVGALGAFVSYAVLLPLAIALSLLISELSVRLVEKPAQRLGRYLDRPVSISSA